MEIMKIMTCGNTELVGPDYQGKKSQKIDLTVILLNPISRLSRICVRFTSLIKLVWVSIDCFDTFYSRNTIFILNLINYP